MQRSIGAVACGRAEATARREKTESIVKRMLAVLQDLGRFSRNGQQLAEIHLRDEERTVEIEVLTLNIFMIL